VSTPAPPAPSSPAGRRVGSQPLERVQAASVIVVRAARSASTNSPPLASIAP